MTTGKYRVVHFLVLFTISFITVLSSDYNTLNPANKGSVKTLKPTDLSDEAPSRSVQQLLKKNDLKRQRQLNSREKNTVP